MSKIEPVPLGSVVIDCTPVADFLEDLPAGALMGKRVTQEGYAPAVDEIVSNQEAWGSLVGITTEDIQDIQLTDERVAMLDAYLPAVKKLLELLEETRAKLDDRRHRRIFQIAALVDARTSVDDNPDLRARYERTRAYRSAIGLKSARTRRKNAAQAAARPAPAAEPAAAPADPQP